MAGVDSEIEENVEMLGRRGRRYTRDGHSYNRRYNSYQSRVMRPQEHFHISANNGHFERFVETFVEGHPEMLSWNSGVYYSMNKNKRWNITEEMKNAIENNLEEFVDHKSDLIIEILNANDLNSKANHKSVYSNRNEVPVRHSKSKAHGSLTVDYRKMHIDALYVKIYEKNDNRYILAGDYYNSKYDKNKVSKNKDKTPWGKDTESTLYLEEGTEEEIDVEQGQTYHREFDAFPLDYFLVPKKTKRLNSNQRKQKKDNNERENKKRKLEYYWDYVNTNVDSENNPDSQVSSIRIMEESYLENLKELRKISVQINIAYHNVVLPENWELYKGNTFPRRLRIENQHENILIIMEEESKEHSLFSLALYQDGIDSSVYKFDLLEQILMENAPLTLTTLCNIVHTLSSSNEIRKHYDNGMVLIMDKDSMHKTIFNYNEEDEECEDEGIGDHLSESVCGICFTETDLSCLQSCCHTFCSQCWGFYTATQIKAGSTVLTCPAYLCDSHLDLTTVAWHAGADLFNQYKSYQVNAAVEKDSLYNWCPNPRCQRLVMIQKTGVHTVNCLCGSSWCVSCKDSSHWPASCQDFLDFRSFNKEIEKYNALENTVHGRPCPKCRTMWEKIYGCNHMSCSKCGTQFCWGCGEEHDSTYYCGSVKIPLESVTILPMPTEKFSLARIESFHQYAAFNKLKLITEREKEKIIHRFLGADRATYFEMMMSGLEENTRYTQVTNLVEEAIYIIKTSKVLMTNNFLTNKFCSKVKMNRLLRAKPLLLEVTRLLKHQKLTMKTVEKTIRDTDRIVKQLEKYNRQLVRMTTNT